MAEVAAEGRYEDLGLIGVGGMGEVRRVRDRQLHRTVAMKVIRADQLDRPAAVARFVEDSPRTIRSACRFASVLTGRLAHLGMRPARSYAEST